MRQHAKLGVVLASLWVSMALGAAETDEVASVTQVAGASLDARPPVAFEAESRTYVARNGEALPSDPAELSQEAVWVNGEQYAVTSTNFRPGENGEMAADLAIHRIWDGTRYWGWQASLREGTRRASVKEPADGLNRLLYDPTVGAFLDGRLTHNFDGTWMELLADDPSLKALGESKVDGCFCMGLSAHTSHGDYEIWLDPAAGFVPRHVWVELDADDTAWGEVLGEIQDAGLDQRFTGITVEVKDVKVDNLDGVWFPVAGALETNYTFSDGTSVRALTEVTRSKVRFSPDFGAEGAFTVDFREGESVEYRYSNDVRLHYVWTSGALVPAVDDEVVSGVEAALPETIEAAANTGVLTALQPQDLVLAENSPVTPSLFTKTAVAVSSLGIAALGLLAFSSRRLFGGMYTGDDT